LKNNALSGSIGIGHFLSFEFSPIQLNIVKGDPIPYLAKRISGDLKFVFSPLVAA
jgi:hypothetical protein